MNNIDIVIEKVKLARKEKGYSHENMANELGISQATYTNIEKNNIKLTVERLLKIAEVLEKPRIKRKIWGIKNVKHKYLPA